MVNGADTARTPAQLRMHRPGLRSFAAMVRAEALMVIRDTAGLAVPLGLPVLILVMNGMSIQDAELADGSRVIDVYVLPVVAAVIVATIGVINMPSFLATYRKEGVLARLELTPVSPLMVLAAQVIVSVLQTVVGIGIALFVAIAFFGASFPSAPVVALGVFALVITAMYAVGMMVAAVSPTANASVAIGLAVFFAMAAVGGMFGPVENLPDSVARVGAVLPFGAAAEAMSAAWVGDLPARRSVLALAAAVVLPGAIAARTFRWSSER